jgi:HPt (histidine-containing phosphotransfer) domain-containing protein
MPRSLLEFFADESGDYLDKMERALAAGPTPDADELRRFARALRGSARMADQDAIARAAGAVQGAAADLAAGRRHWGADLKGSLESALRDIRGMVDSVKSPPPDIGKRAEAIAERLGATSPPPPPPKDDERFRRYLGTELRGLATDIGESLVVLERDPRNREPLKRLLRRIRPLRGIEGVDEIPAVGPAVTALEEVILRIADTSATVGPGHLVLFRRARQALDDVATELIRGEQPSGVVEGAVEIEDLKEQVLETAAQREITWISELFHDDPGPHIEACPMAERGAGSWEGFFALEATGSLDTIERLRAELAHAPEGASRIAERLTYSFRQLRERAVTFGHTGLGRVARRAGAAVRASRDQPPWRLQAIAVDLAVTIAALRSYLEASEKGVRDSALRRAEDSLEAATHPTRGPTVEIETLLYSAEDAIARARSLSGELAGLLRVETIDFGRAQHLLDEALGLIEHALVQTAAAQ